MPIPHTTFEAISVPLSDRIAETLERLSRVVQNQAWETGGALGQTPTQLRILRLVAEAEAPLGTQAIAACLQVSPPTVSDAIAALERKGLLLRTPAAHDRRARELSLTEQGLDLLAAQDPTAALKRAVASLPAPLQADLLLGLLGTVRALQRQDSMPLQRLCLTCRHFQPNRHAGQPLAHHCGLVDAPMGGRHLRLDCPEHDAAPARQQRAAWQSLIDTSAPPMPKEKRP